MYNNKLIINRYKNYLVIYKKYDKHSNLYIYYYKYVCGYYDDYYVGKKNAYGHEIVLIIEVEYYKQKTSLKVKLIRKIIRFFERLEKSFY